MKAKILFWLPAIALVFALTIIACDNGTGGGGGRGPGVQKPGGTTPVLATYVSYDEYGNEYKLEFGTDANMGRAANPNRGNHYRLTITSADDETDKVESTGTVTEVTDITTEGAEDAEGITRKRINLRHNSDAEIDAIVFNDTGEITSFHGNNKRIPIDGNRVRDMPESLPYALNYNGEREEYILIDGKAITDASGLATIRGTFRRRPVTAISYGAFQNLVYNDESGYYQTGENTDLKRVIIEEGITSIGGWTFYNCTSLTSITIPASVTAIGGFDHPDDSTFLNCTSIASVTFAEGFSMSIGNWFRGLSSLTSVTIGEGATSIEGWAFYECTNLTSITIPASVTAIGGLDYGDSSAFSRCYSLTSVTFAPNSKLKTIGNRAFLQCTSLTGITIPANVTAIGENAFREAGITSITIGKGVTFIGDEAFYACYSLTSVTFAEGFSMTIVNWFPHSSFITSATIGEGVTSIGKEAFAFFPLTSVTIPASVTSIGDNAFYACSSLTSVTFAPNSKLKTIGSETFSECRSLTSITIPAGVTSIGYWAFSNCKSPSITIPAGVTYVGKDAFINWVPPQTINVQGKADRAATIAAGWDNEWDKWCNATIIINYQP